VDQDSTVTARDVGVLQDDIIVRGAADGVQADFQRIDVIAIDEPEFETRGDGGRVERRLNESVGTIGRN
jgi:hypothetical protein